MPLTSTTTATLLKLRGADPLVCAGRPRPANRLKGQRLHFEQQIWLEISDAGVMDRELAKKFFSLNRR